MTPQYVLRQGLDRAFVWDRLRSSYTREAGYLLNNQNPFDPMNALEELRYRVHSVLSHADSEIENMRWHEGYAEPGYRDPDKGVLLADWNDLPKRTIDLLEQYGYEMEWSDEWTDCCDCYKLIRTSPDCYSWQKHWVWVNECEIVCLDCLKKSGAEDYLRKLEDDADMAVMRQLDPTDYGYELVDPDQYDYETGWHRGQDDDPKKVLEELHSRGITRVVFQVSESSQFYSKWRAYAHPLRKGAVVRVKDEDETYILMDAPRESGYVSGMDREGCEVSLDPDELEVVE